MINRIIINNRKEKKEDQLVNNKKKINKVNLKMNLNPVINHLSDV
jgi:hypothetical protein